MNNEIDPSKLEGYVDGKHRINTSSRDISSANKRLTKSTTTRKTPIGQQNTINQGNSNRNSVDDIRFSKVVESYKNNKATSENSMPSDLAAISTLEKLEASKIETRKLLDSLNVLHTTILPFSYDSYDMGTTKMIKNIGPNRFFWIVGVGYAEFNRNPGMIYTAGVTYDVDRIIDLELNTSYAYGRGSEVMNRDSVTKEQQLDVNLLVQLNFIKNSKHKFSFDIGGGLTKYSGQRLVPYAEPTLDIRSSNGFNIQGGLSYHFSIDHDTKIGIKYGVISYDDAIEYITTRFIKRF